jgi:selenium metabolism protein YedF
MEKDSTVIYVRSDRMGAGAEQLGRLLMTSFLETLASSPTRPSRMLFVNSGVFLTTEGSDVLDALKRLEAEGVEILSCGTCLDYYRRKDNLRVGKIGNMAGTVETLMNAGKILSP